jgi:serine/threonine-protein kinase
VTLVAGTRIGKYEIRRKLAEGGMAEIYLCSFSGPEGFQKEVVLKQIRSFLAQDPDFVQMFITEARVASLLNHANIVQIFDFDKHQDTYYLAMEYVRGQSLYATRKRARELMIPMPPTLVAHLGAEIARGLHYAHRQTENGRHIGLVHRDVTPHNVLLSFEGAVKLTDFGIAKAGNSLTAPGKLKGKFAYMSPEQAQGLTLDARTDVFALGIILWELLTGGRLFDGDGDVAVLRAVQESTIAPPARLNSLVPESLSRTVMKALERDVNARFRTAQEFERSLAEYVLLAAKKIEDTDIGAFLRRLFSGEASAVCDLDQDSDPIPVEVSSSPEHLPSPSPQTKEADFQVASMTELEAPTESWRMLDQGPPLQPLRRQLRESTPPEQPPETASFRSRHLLLFRAGLLVLGSVFLCATTWLGLRLRSPAPKSLEKSIPQPARPGLHPDVLPIPIPSYSPNIPFPQSPLAAIPEPSPPPVVDQPVRARPATGVLVVKISPWAELFIDGKNRGEVSGIRKFKLRVGKHRIQFRHVRGLAERTVIVKERQEVVEQYQALSP